MNNDPYTNRHCASTLACVEISCALFVLLQQQ